MSKPLRLLIIEDKDDDALLEVGELREWGFEPDYLRVETPQDLEAALQAGSWDAILADYNMPSFTGMDALRIVQSKGLDLPFLLVSGAVGEDRAVDAMKAGAHDYIMKGNLARLAPAVERELAEARVRRERRQALELLQEAHDELEDRVRERTAELKNANEALQIEINERKRAEAVLRESEERFRLLADAAPVYIWMSGIDSLCTFFNKRWLTFTGRSMEQELGNGWSEGVHPDDLQRCFDAYLPAFEQRQEFQMDYRLRRADGEYRWILDVGVPRFAPNGDFLGFIGSCFDITERKQAREEIERLNADLAARAADLEDLNQELEAFNYTVAHDLRNPLNVITSYCQVYKELCGDRCQEECNDYVQEAYNAALRMDRLIDALLNFSRMGHVEPQRKMVDLSGIAQAVALELKLGGPERQVDFRIADGIAAKADPNLLRVVLNNLLGNAWKYTGNREEAVIEFGTREIGGKIVYFVGDNGAGFDQADAVKLFVPFQRLPGAETFRGFGIGLATVERIVRRHGGRIWAEGEPDKGTTFYFTLSADGV